MQHALSHPERRVRVDSPEAVPFLLVPEPILPGIDHPCRIPVKNVEEAEFLAAVLQQHCGLYLGARASEYRELADWADTTPVGVSVGQSWRKEPLEHLSELLSRVPVRNPVSEGRQWFEAGESQAMERIASVLVHKRDPANVLLANACRVGALQQYNAFTDSPEFVFDHPSDHVQGMLLTEIARQACIAVVHQVGLPLGWIVVLTRLSLDFQRFVRSDAPMVVRAFTSFRLPEWEGPVRSDGRRNRSWVFVQVWQQGNCCFSGHITGVSAKGPS
ncbi:AfsA-related hotdog domain-containing protein [Stigmatella sp. ncwal1]|uniref:AfsA-related hotdog domain-containing protein n=1 Tax=Stigmatella ashevillensis TaxID=2995309 RepID=A0ABT5DIA8_9BACT|nr:AfsA-related hotdog domain-containing protein [Stigmatella ashevillena]MDC0712503.1 AfsA-related hotdog domain-containing protein [Stigmatella ashevillena]